MNPELQKAYRYHRQQASRATIKGPYGALRLDPSKRLGHCTAWEALNLARSDVENGKARYPSAGPKGWGNAVCDGAVWIESLDAAGLRFVDFADVLAGHSLKHRGWFTSDDGDNGETLRGVVLQMPAHGRRARYLAAYADPNNEGAYRVELQVWEGDKGGSGDQDRYGVADDAFTAAIQADRFAERTAEKERDHNRAWQAGRRFEDLADVIRGDRTTALQLIRELKSIRRVGSEVQVPVICAALRDKLQRLQRDIKKAREERADLKANFGNESAFLNA